jgi:predicted NBD/HSP70 family sugar kinase
MREATVRSLRRRNRAVVLRHVVLNQTTTRAAIASECDLSLSTVNNVLADLMQEGLVQENGSLPSDGGRPIARICVAPEGATMIGVDVGEQGVTVELFDLCLSKVDRVFRELPRTHATPERVARAVTEAVGAIRTANPGFERTLIGAGLGLPGVVDPDVDGDVTLFAQSLGWQPIRVSELFGDVGVPIFADNGAKTLAMAEMWFGAARGVRHSIVALIGRGIGAGVISDGRLLRGLSSAGEWGHTKISLDGPLCPCGSAGCLEAYAGGGAVMRRWQEAGGLVSGPQEQVLSKLIEAATGGDAAAVRVLDQTIEALAVGLANLVNLFSPEQIVIGGWAGLRLFEARGAEMTRLVRHFALGHPGDQCRIEPCRFGDDAIALGAALLPLEQLIEGTLRPSNVKA